MEEINGKVEWKWYGRDEGMCGEEVGRKREMKGKVDRKWNGDKEKSGREKLNVMNQRKE